MTYQGHQGDGPPRIVRPPPSSIELLTPSAPFDGRTNYRDEFTGRQKEPTAVEKSVVPDVAEPEDIAPGFVLQLRLTTTIFYSIHISLCFVSNYCKIINNNINTINIKIERRLLKFVNKLVDVN